MFLSQPRLQREASLVLLIGQQSKFGLFEKHFFKKSVSLLNNAMKTNIQLPIKFSLGELQYEGTIEKMKGKGNQIYFHTIFSGVKYTDVKFDADFYPVKIEILNQTLIKWECKSENIRESFKYPAAVAIEKRLKESHIPLF